MSIKDEFLAKLKTQLDGWQVEVDELEAKAEDAADEIKAELEEQIANLKVKFTEGETKFNSMILALENRFMKDMEDIVAQTAVDGRKQVVLLSSGTDSFIVLAVLRWLIPERQIHTVTIRGIDNREATAAEMVASHFRTEHTVRTVSLDEIMANLHLVRGMGYHKLKKILSHVCYHLALSDCSVKGAYVYTGHGAGSLYGNKQRIYKKVDQIITEKGISEDEARTLLKSEYCATSQAAFLSGDTGTAGVHVAKIIGNLGATCILPYRDTRLQYLSNVPFSVIRPFDKAFVKNAVKRRYGLGAIADRQRMSVQDGTGLYDLLAERVRQLYPEIGPSVSDIARHLSA